MAENGRLPVGPEFVAITLGRGLPSCYRSSWVSGRRYDNSRIRYIYCVFVFFFIEDIVRMYYPR